MTGQQPLNHPPIMILLSIVGLMRMMNRLPMLRGKSEMVGGSLPVARIADHEQSDLMI